MAVFKYQHKTNEKGSINYTEAYKPFSLFEKEFKTTPQHSEDREADYPVNRSTKNIYFLKDEGIMIRITLYPEREYYPSYISAERITGEVLVSVQGNDKKVSEIEQKIQELFENNGMKKKVN